MLGAIIGDIVGSRFEFDNTNTTTFELFTKECAYTDDTVCTIAVADALLSGSDFKTSLLKWCRKYPNPMGAYGGSFVRWIHAANPQPYNSFGNGSAMRVSPCGWLPRQEEVIGKARQSAQCTHNHPEGIKGAQCVAECIYATRLARQQRIDENSPVDGKQQVRAIAAKYGYDLTPTCDEIRRTNTFNETCQVTVPQALTCFLESTDFESAVRLAVSIGGDSDTIAAIAGSIAEAHYDIPQTLLEQAWNYLPQEMQEVVCLFREKYQTTAESK